MGARGSRYIIKLLSNPSQQEVRWALGSFAHFLKQSAQSYLQNFNHEDSIGVLHAGVCIVVFWMFKKADKSKHR